MTPFWRRGSEAGAPRGRAPLSRRFTYRYVLGIAVFAVVGLYGTMRSNQSLQAIEDASRQLSAAASQATRAERIVDLARRVDEEATHAERNQQVIDGLSGRLQQEVNAFRQTHNGLIHGDTQMQLSAVPLDGRLQDLYFGGGRLDQTVTEMAKAAEFITTLTEPPGPRGDNTEARAGQLAVLLDKHDAAVDQLTTASRIYGEIVEGLVKAQQDVNLTLLLVGAVAAVAAALVLFRPMAQQIRLETTNLEQAERRARENNDRQTFRNDLRQSLENTTSEDEIIDAARRAVGVVIPANPAELLLIDPDTDRIHTEVANLAVGGAGCPVDSADGCAAIRRSQNQVYESSRMLNVCPKLPRHTQGPCSAVCVPVQFGGRPIGVLHTTGPDVQPPNHTQIERLTVLGQEVGSRLGTLRVTALTKQQADTDGLTQLFNRRSLERELSSLQHRSVPFSLAIADLDHFKDLNDTYGHDAGDEALRLFARVLGDYLLPGDIAARYGGEEFVVVFPSTTVHEARAALERLQMALASEVESTSGIPPFTASWGLTDSSAGSAFEEIIAVADAALYGAKRAGRDCIMVDGLAAAAAGPVPAEATWVGSSDGEATRSGRADGDGQAAVEIDVDMLEAGSIRKRGPQPF